jgi:hypothetical protein
MILPDHLQVALMIESTQWPYRVLLIRGMAEVDTVEGVSPAYAAAAERYFGEEHRCAWVEQVRTLSAYMARISIRPM